MRQTFPMISPVKNRVFQCYRQATAVNTTVADQNTKGFKNSWGQRRRPYSPVTQRPRKTVPAKRQREKKSPTHSSSDDMKRSYNIILQFEECLAAWDVFFFLMLKGGGLSWQLAAVHSVGPRGHSTGSKQGWRVFLWGGGPPQGHTVECSSSRVMYCHIVQSAP